MTPCWVKYSWLHVILISYHEYILPALSVLPGLCGEVCCYSDVPPSVHKKSLPLTCSKDSFLGLRFANLAITCQVLMYFFLFFWVGPLCFLDWNAYFLLQIREVLAMICRYIPSSPRSLSTPLGIPIILTLMFLMASLFSLSSSKCATSCLSLSRPFPSLLSAYLPRQ